MNNLWRRLSVVGAAAIVLAGCAAQQLHRDGLAAIDKGDYEQGVADLTQAAQRSPDNMTYKLDLQLRREQAIAKLIADADAARGAGDFDRAAASYQRVLGLQPRNDRAQRGLDGLTADRHHAAIVAEAQKDLEHKDLDAAELKIHGVLTEDPSYAPAEDLRDKIILARGPITVIPKLKTRNDAKVTLQFRDAPTKMVFEVLSRQTDINFILDKDVKSDGKTTIFVQDVPIDEAIDLVLDQNGLTRQILTSNMVLIYPNTAAKQKDYEQQIVRTFYLTNAAPKDVESLLKTVLNAKTLYINERANVVIIRDTPDAIRMAEKLVASVDVPESEVMLEVQVLEIERSKITDLGIAYPSSVTATMVSPEGNAGLIVNDLNHPHLVNSTLSSLSVTLNAMENAGLTNTLASPRIRVRNNEKAKILIGSRVPVITNSVTPTAGGTAVVTGNVQYLDVGLSLDVQPTIRLDGDVAIKIGLEVSTITGTVTPPQGGTVAYTIGTRNANTLLELKDGETQILAGLISDSDTRSASNIPGLGDLPVIGRLFGSTNADREKSEIVLSITPHIIRAQTRPAGDVTEFWYGSESRTSASPFGAALSSTSTSAPSAAARSPAAGPSMSTVSGGSLAPAILSGSGSVSGGAASTPSVPASVAAMNGATVGTSVDAVLRAEAAQAQTTGAPPKTTTILDGPTEVKVGQEFDVNVKMTTDGVITHLHGQVRFDPSAIQLLSATAGDAIPASAGSPTVDERSGGAQIDVTSSEDPIPSGGVMLLHFKALAPRSASALAAQVAALGPGGVPIANAPAPPLNVLIQNPN